jgi:hypothetical protein
MDTGGPSTLFFLSLPDEAGVDPFLLLIDRIPDDNTKKVTLTSASAASTNQVPGK